MLLIDDILDGLSLSAVFTKLDLDSGYHLVSLEPKDAHKIAFLSKWGYYEYTVLLLGLTNAPTTFLRLMNQILRLWLDKGVAVYLDDIIIYSKNLEEYVYLLLLDLAQLKEHQLFVRLSKCKFRVRTIEFLGHVISSKGIQPDPGKIKSIQLWPVPTSVHDMLVFIGMAGYCSRFTHKYANKAAALMDLLKKINKWQWTTAALEIFEQRKPILRPTSVFLYPCFDLPFVYSTDTSDIAVRATLLLDLGLILLPLCYASRKLNLAELLYSTEDREFLEIVFVTVKYRRYLAGGPKRVVCLTNHEPLMYLLSKRDLNKRLSRWIEKIVDVNPVILLVPGKEQVVPDALSCRPDYG